MDKKNDFYSDIDEIKKEYKTNPDMVSRYTHDTLIKIRNSNKENKTELTENGRYVLYTIILCIVIVLFGLININNGFEDYALYFFGFLFFIAGYFIGNLEIYFNLIFLFSHGLTGFCLMNIPILKNVIENPSLTDGGNGVYIYLGGLLLLTIFSFLYEVYASVTKKYSKHPYMKFHTLVPYAIVTLLVQILPHILNFLLTL